MPKRELPKEKRVHHIDQDQERAMKRRWREYRSVVGNDEWNPVSLVTGGTRRTVDRIMREGWGDE